MSYSKGFYNSLSQLKPATEPTMTKVCHSLASEILSYSELHHVIGCDRERLFFHEVLEIADRHAYSAPSDIGRGSPFNQILKSNSLRSVNHASCRTISAAFSAIMIVGALVLAPTSLGMIDASTTRKPSIP